MGGCPHTGSFTGVHVTLTMCQTTSWEQRAKPRQNKHSFFTRQLERKEQQRGEGCFTVLPEVRVSRAYTCIKAYCTLQICTIHCMSITLKRGIGVVTAFLKRRLIFQSHTDTCVDEMIPCLGFSSTQLGRSGRVVHRTGHAQLADLQSWTWAHRAVLPAFRVLQTSHNKARESHARTLSFCSLTHLRCPNVEGN